MRRYSSCRVLVSASCLACLLAAEVAWCAEPSENEAAVRSLVRSALQSEVAGDAQRRRELLEQALMMAPAYPPANWPLGRIEVGGRWATLDEAVRLDADNRRRIEYRRMRDEALGDARRELNLARWCAQERLSDEAQLHYARLLHVGVLDQKTRAEAMRVLQLREIGGTLVTEEQFRQAKEAASQIQQAAKRWEPKFRAWQKAIDGTNAASRVHAIEQMRKIDDPHVIPLAESFLLACGPAYGEQLAGLLARFPQWEATQALARAAVLPQWPNVRQEAIRRLKQRPMHEYMPLLLSSLVSPVRSRWSVTDNAWGAIQYEHRFFREGPNQNLAVAMEHVALPVLQITDSVAVGPPIERFNLPSDPERFPIIHWGRTYEFRGYDIVNDSNQYLAALSCLMEAQRRERILGDFNAAVDFNNEPVFTALEETTGRFHHRNPAAWWDWWEKYNEVHNEVVPGKPIQYLFHRSWSTQDIYARELYQPVDLYFNLNPNSCFLAGTTVWTDRGRIPIEQIKIGDRVLSKDPDSGKLAFKLVLNTTIRPPASMTKITVDGEDLITTLGHPFWVSKKRWCMAKELEPGDQLHGVHGILSVDATDTHVPMNVAHNLVVADWATYFVGEKGALVHDNTYRAPARALIPGLVIENE